MVGGLPNYYYVRGGAEAANLYEWGGYDSNGSTWGFERERPGWGDKPIHQLMAENHVSAFFYGHDHEYAYQARDGVVYQLVPAPSMTGYGFNLYKESDPHTIKVLPNSGHVRVTVSPSQATVDYVQTSGAGVAHTYQIVSVNPTVTISKPGAQPRLDWPAARTCYAHWAMKATKRCAIRMAKATKCNPASVSAKRS